MKTATDKSSMTNWYPLIKTLDIPQPKTVTINTYPIDHFEWVKYLEEGARLEHIDAFEKALTMACTEMGFPAFIRTDHISGKHRWNHTCFVDSRENVVRNFRGVLESSFFANIFGLPINAFYVREYVPMDNLFTAFNYNMPVNSEVRLFIKDGELVCKHWYWAEDAIRNPSNPDYKDILKAAEKTAFEELGDIPEQYAHEIGSVLDGAWSVDLCRSRKGEWYLIDMAAAELSWHPETCKHRKLK